MAEIMLTRGYVAIVDDADFEWLNRWRWHAHRVQARYYAARNASKPERKAGRPSLIYMHREVFTSPDGRLTDHQNRSSLDNRRANLRPATYVENGANCTKAVGVSGYRGVWPDRTSGRWRAGIAPNGGGIHLGYFADPVTAARAYDAAARAHYGEFAILNFPEAA